MRVLLVLIALLAAPLSLSVAQDRGSSPNPPAWGRTGARGLGHNEAHCTARAEAHPGKEINKCEPPPPTEPPAPTGTAGISGKVYHNIDGRPALASWIVTLDGAASAVTDELGRYAFTSLSGGNHWVCVVVQEGWFQQQPTTPAPCANGIGNTVTLAEGQAWPFAHFAMMPQ